MDYTLSDLESAFYAGRLEKDIWERTQNPDYLHTPEYKHENFKAYMTSLEAFRQKISEKTVSNTPKQEKVSYKSSNDSTNGYYGC